MWILYGLAYLLLIGFFLMERFVRVGQTRRMDREDADRGSTTVVSIVMGIAFVLIPLSPLFNWLHVGAMRDLPAGLLASGSLGVGALGVVLGLIGLQLRYRAFTELGRFFTRTLRQTEEHQLVTSGIYRSLRHPGYLSDLFIFFGASLAMNNWITALVVLVTFIPAYLYRIRVEEQMLLKAFGQAYADYQRTSKRLIPGIW